VEARQRGAQTALAAACGVTPQTVNKWVDGQVVPKPERWAAIEQALDMEPGHLSALVEVPTATDRLEQLRERIKHDLLAELSEKEGAAARFDAIEARLDRIEAGMKSELKAKRQFVALNPGQRSAKAKPGHDIPAAKAASKDPKSRTGRRTSTNRPTGPDVHPDEPAS
jgi:DNA-binding transcriptional regulator YdaS (Cro superfamily)